MKKKIVTLTLYRYAGKFLFFRIKKRCNDCDISYVILQRLMNEQLRGKPVTLRIIPWLDNFWKIIWRGGWHAPILTVNGKVFSQGRVPDIPKLLSTIGKILNDTTLIQQPALKTEKVVTPDKGSEITLYFSPACPHCRQLLSYLDNNGIKYVGKDVTQTESARMEVEKLTGRLTIPVVIVKGEIISGLDINRLANILGISPDIRKIEKLHDFYFAERDPADESLVSIVHPWESGLDNAPLWDEPLAAITDTSEWALSIQKKYAALAEQGERPKRTYIEKYSYLIENLYKNNYDWKKISAKHPFLIQGVLFNSILCRSELDLAKIAEALGYDAHVHYERADKLKTAANKKFYDDTEGIYYNFDLVRKKHIKRDTIFSYMPLFAGIPDRDTAKVVLDTLRTHCFCIADMDCVAIPSYDMCQVDYEGEFYWRGPVWVNINWYIAKGVRQYGETELADWIENSLIALADRYGFYEYYDPDTGKGLGEKDFSWTAALIIDLVAQKLRNESPFRPVSDN